MSRGRGASGLARSGPKTSGLIRILEDVPLNIMISTPGGRGWHSRGYLPHLEVAGRTTGITFRLADSLPRDVVGRWKQMLLGKSHEEAKIELRRRIAAWEDAGRGHCWLLRNECAAAVEEALLHFDGDRYRLVEWCVMPNHVHVLLRLEPGQSFERIVRSWKNFTAKRINAMVGRSGSLWAPDYFDRLIRDGEHLANARRYVRMNPVKAGRCLSPEKWRWSSAWEGRRK